MNGPTNFLLIFIYFVPDVFFYYTATPLLHFYNDYE